LSRASAKLTPVARRRTAPNLRGDIVHDVTASHSPTDEHRPVLIPLAAPAEPKAIVLLLHGGRETGYGRVPAHRLSFVRMRPFARAVHERSRNAAVALLRYRYRGWNAPDADPVRDTEWALEQLLQTHGALPVILVGHSMGGRAALRGAGHPRVVAVAGLAPWLPRGEPIDQLEDRDVLLMHGTADLTTSAKATVEFARTIAPIARRVACVQIKRSSHGMLQRAGLWHELTAAYVDNIVNGSPLPAPLLEGFEAGARGEAIRV
jgi:alpha-beta hydrolase superfamily lysophospholipase